MTTLDDAPLIRREFQSFREELRQDFHAFREELHRELQHYATKADVAELKAEVAETKAELIKWIVGLMFGAIAAATTFAFAVERLLGN